MTQLSLFADDPRPPRVRSSDTSTAAAESVQPVTGELRRRVLSFIRSRADGATCDEAEVALGLRHQTASARIRELVTLGAIADSGQRRKTRSGRTASVYRVKGEST